MKTDGVEGRVEGSRAPTLVTEVVEPEGIERVAQDLVDEGNEVRAWGQVFVLGFEKVIPHSLGESGGIVEDVGLPDADDGPAEAAEGAVDAAVSPFTKTDGWEGGR
jgi:hypothetical protein